MTAMAKGGQAEAAVPWFVDGFGLSAEQRSRITVQREWQSPALPFFISLLLPSRLRPDLLRRFLDSVAATAHNPDRIEVVLYTDNDDSSTVGISSPRLNLTRLRGPRMHMSQLNSACAECSSGQLLMLVNDDVVVETVAWDQALENLRAQHQDEIFLAWPRDGVMNERLATFPILSRRSCSLLCEPFGSGYRRLYIDAHVMDVFTRLCALGLNRMHFLGDVVFRHCHDAPRSGRRTDLTDDLEFLRQRGLRQWQAATLNAAARGQDKPANCPLPEDMEEPGSMWQALRLYTGALLLDPDLPWRERLTYWLRFSGHYAMTRTAAGDHFTRHGGRAQSGG